MKIRGCGLLVVFKNFIISQRSKHILCIPFSNNFTACAADHDYLLVTNTAIKLCRYN